MSQRFQDFETAVDLASNDWRTIVGNPYVISYTQAYSKYKETLDKQKESDKEAGELFVTAACVATGSILLGSIGSVTLRMIAKRSVVSVARRTLNDTMFRLFRSVRKNDGVAFAVVIEIHEHVAPLAFPLADAIGPPGEVGIRIRAAVEMLGVRPVQPQVDEGRRRPEDARQVRPAHHAVGGAVPFEQRVDRVVVPAGVAELDRQWELGRPACEQGRAPRRARGSPPRVAPDARLRGVRGPLQQRVAPGRARSRRATRSARRAG